MKRARNSINSSSSSSGLPCFLASAIAIEALCGGTERTEEREESQDALVVASDALHLHAAGFCVTTTLLTSAERYLSRPSRLHSTRKKTSFSQEESKQKKNKPPSSQHPLSPLLQELHAEGPTLGEVGLSWGQIREARGVIEVCEHLLVKLIETLVAPGHPPSWGKGGAFEKGAT